MILKGTFVAGWRSVGVSLPFSQSRPTLATAVLDRQGPRWSPPVSGHAHSSRVTDH